MALGAGDYIRKPFKKGELLACIQVKLRRANLKLFIEVNNRPEQVGTNSRAPTD